MEGHFRVKWLRTSASRTEGKRWTWFRARAVLCWMGMTLLTLGVNAPAIILSSAILLASYSRAEMSACRAKLKRNRSRLAKKQHLRSV